MSLISKTGTYKLHIFHMKKCIKEDYHSLASFCIKDVFVIVSLVHSFKTHFPMKIRSSLILFDNYKKTPAEFRFGYFQTLSKQHLIGAGLEWDTDQIQQLKLGLFPYPENFEEN